MRHRLRGEDGANAVEFALILPMFIMLIFGAITAGLALNSRQQLDHASREGVRYGATLPFEAQPCDDSAPFRNWGECVRDRVLATSVGTVQLASGGVCITHVAEDGTTNQWIYGPPAVQARIVDSGAPGQHCILENPALNGARVQVKVLTPAAVNAVFFRTGVFDLTARAVARYEEG